jgi:type I restriction enzyme S subunit
LAALISGTSYNKGDVCKEGIRILRGGNIQETKLLTYDNDVFLPYSYADENKQIRIDDIIIVGSTGSKEVIGKPAFITAQCADTQIGAFLRIVRPYFSYYASYLQILFSTNYYRRHIQTKVKGTNINNIKAEYIANLLVPIPPQKEMERIVAKKEELYSKL